MHSAAAAAERDRIRRRPVQKHQGERLRQQGGEAQPIAQPIAVMTRPRRITMRITSRALGAERDADAELARTGASRANAITP